MQTQVLGRACVVARSRWEGRSGAWTMTSLATRRCRSTTASIVSPSAQLENARPYEQVPGPKPLPLIGNLWRFMPSIGTYDLSNLINFYSQLNKEYGNIAKISHLKFKNDLLFICNPEDIEQIYRHEGQWPERPAFKSMLHYRKVTRKDFFEGHGGVLLNQGKEWQEARSEVNPVMMQPRVVQLYAGPINEVAEDFVSRIPEWKDAKNEMPEYFCNEIHKWALESIARIALDTRLGCLEPNLAPDSEPQKMINAVHTMFKCLHVLESGAGIWQFIPTPTWRKFVSTMDFFVDVCMKYINQSVAAMQQRQHGSQEDMGVLERLLSNDPNPKRVVIMALDMLFAGVDTTSYTLANVLLHLSANQDKQEKLYKELHKFMPDPSVTLTPEILNEMKYLRACIKESMRLVSIATGNARTTKYEIVLSNFHIPKGVDIIMTNGFISLDDKHFPEAKSFIPERHLRHSGPVNKEECPFPGVKTNPYVSMPFGHGARKCVGMRFASLELEVVLAKLIRRFRWDYKYGEMKYKSSIIHAPVDPLRFAVEERT